MAGLCTPLPTLRLYLHRHLRTARGRCGSLLLHRGGLSPPTPCRFHRRTERVPVTAVSRCTKVDSGVRPMTHRAERPTDRRAVPVRYVLGTVRSATRPA